MSIVEIVTSKSKKYMIIKKKKKRKGGNTFNLFENSLRAQEIKSCQSCANRNNAAFK